MRRKILRGIDWILDLRDRQRLCIALSKGGAMMHARRLDLTSPTTWEFSGSSQNGEDGILDVLRGQLLESNRYFIEIGSGDGLQNNCTWLAVAEQYNGLMIDSNPRHVRRLKRMIGEYSISAECYCFLVTRDSVEMIQRLALYNDPDVFSLDIDGCDYYIVQQLFAVGFRPKIFAVEYNSAYGPTRSITIRYSDSFSIAKAHPTHLYYGVSIMGWRNFFAKHGYHFITVERNGVNAFFVDSAYFKSEFLRFVRPLEFAENGFLYKKFQKPNEEQFRLVAGQDFAPI